MSLLKYNFSKTPNNDLPTHKVPTSTIKSNIDLSTSSTIAVTKSSDYIDNNSYPDCWDSKQKIFKTAYLISKINAYILIIYAEISRPTSY